MGRSFRIGRSYPVATVAVSVLCAPLHYLGSDVRLSFEVVHCASNAVVCNDPESCASVEKDCDIRQQ